MASSTSPPATFHSLPPELVDEILCSSDLSNRDLVQCCLVSQQFLPSARRSLYSTVSFQLDWHELKALWIPETATSKLLATVQQNLSLGRLCICLRVESTEYTLFRRRTSEEELPAEIIDEWFRLFPNLRMLSAPWFSHPRFRPPALFQLGQRKWTALNLDVPCPGDSLEESSGGEASKKLVFRDLVASSSNEEVRIPSSVVTLKLWSDEWELSPSAYASLRPSSNSQLRNLQIQHDVIKLAHLADFPRLRYLSIDDIRDGSHNLAPLNRLTRLQRLSLGFAPKFQIENTLVDLPSNLPPALYRLDFPTLVLDDAVNWLLPRTGDLSISQLGLSETVTWRLDHVEREGLDHLRDWCAGRGIEIIYFGCRDPIFHF